MTRQPIKHHDVSSSSVQRVGYDADSRELHVTFNTGARYTYHDVPPETHEALMMSGSKGSFLHENIKGRHDFTKL